MFPVSLHINNELRSTSIINTAVVHSAGSERVIHKQLRMLTIFHVLLTHPKGILLPRSFVNINKISRMWIGEGAIWIFF